MKTFVNLDEANAEIQRLAAEIATLQGKETALNGKVTTLEQAAEGHAGALKTANDARTKAEADLTTARGEIDTLKGKVTEAESARDKAIAKAGVEGLQENATGTTTVPDGSGGTVDKRLLGPDGKKLTGQALAIAAMHIQEEKAKAK